MNEKNYYDEIIEQILEISKEDKERAVLILKKELAMPYIPEEYEKKMNSLLKKLNIKTKKEVTTTREEILETLLSYKNNGQKLFLINKIAEFNWVGYEDKIEEVFNDPQVQANFKSIFIEHLIEQKHDYEFKIGNKKINPSKSKSIFNSEFCVKNINSIETNGEEKDSVLKRIAIETLLIYVSSLFPNNFNLEYKDISTDLFLVGNVLLGKSSNELTSTAKEILDFVSQQE